MRDFLFVSDVFYFFKKDCNEVYLQFRKLLLALVELIKKSFYQCHAFFYKHVAF